MSFGIFQFRRGTAAQWTSANPVLSDGEMGIETDTSFFKIGNGVATWTARPYGGIQGIQGITGNTGNTGVAGDKGWSPILAVVTDSARRVFQIVDWTGGAGTKPSTTNQFIGAAGIVGTAAAAVDIRGPQGTAGTDLSARLISTGAGLTGGGDLSTDRTHSIQTNGVTDAMLAQVTAPVIKGRITAGLGNVEALTPAQVASMFPAATQAAQGMLSAADKIKLDKMWFDATAIGMSTANTGAQNVTAFNAWYATAPTFCTLYIPGDGFYDIASELTLNRDIRLRIIGAGKGRSILRSTSATANIFNQTVAGFYLSIEELGFTSSVTKTAGVAILAQSNNALMDIRRCEFTNQMFGVDLRSAAGNVGVVSECIFSSPSPTANGCQLLINGAGINMMIQNCTINVTGVSTTGIEVRECGALQVSTCDFIGGKNTCLLNSTATGLAAVYFNNVFFDQATFGSTVKIMGSAPLSRCKFVNCGIANGGGTAGNVAVEIAGTGTGTSIPEAIDFLLCDVYNSPAAGAPPGNTTGFLVTGVRGFDVRESRVSAFTFGFDITPYNGNGITNFNISNNTIGPTENFAGNGTGIRINAGAVQYAASNVSMNDLSGNTVAPVVDNGTYTTALQVLNNIGLANNSKPLVATPATIGATETIVHQIPLPAGSLLAGTTIKVTAFGIMTATTPTLTARLRMGTVGTVAGDTAVVATPAVAVATGTGWMVEMFLTVRTIGAGGTWLGNGIVHGTAPGKSIVTATQAVNTTVANFLELTLQGGGTTPVITVVNAFSEVPRQ